MPAPDGAVARVCVYPERDFVAERSDFLSYDYRLEESLSRTKRLARELAYCNHWDYFCTFTFDKDKVDRFSLNEVKKKLSKFFHNYVDRHSSDFKYMVIPEHHSDGAVHFHGLLRNINPKHIVVPPTIAKRINYTLDDKGRKVGGEVVQVPNTPGYLLWTSYKFGYCNISPVNNHFGASNYILKYITKEVQNADFIGKGDRMILASQGLRRALEVVKCSIDYKEGYKLFDEFKSYRLMYDFCDVYDDIPINRLDELLSIIHNVSVTDTGS